MQAASTLGLLSVGLLALLSGFGVYTFYYAGGAAYLRDDPTACVNCHIMNDQYRGWQAGAHRSAAGCNDCHAPVGFFGRYSTKALNGFLHSYAFTTGAYSEPIRIKGFNQTISEGACRSCHGALTGHIDAARDLSCLHCHQDMGH